MARNLYLALGDSITAGYGATHPGMGFVRYVSDYVKSNSIAKHTTVIAQNGWTTKDVYQATRLIHPSVWEQTQVLTLMVGGNDLRTLLRRLYLPVYGEPLSYDLVRQKLQESRYFLNLLSGTVVQYHISYVIMATVYNPVPNSPLAVHAMDSLNDCIRDTAEKYKFQIADIYQAFQNNEAYYIEGYRFGRFEDLATPFRRPIHPNNLGHQQIAEWITKKLNPVPAKTR